MKIHTTNSQGQKVLIEYTQQIIEEPHQKPDIKIDTFEDFKNCLAEMNMQAVPHGEQDVRYKNALFDLLRTDYAKYQTYMEKLQKERGVR